MSIDFILDLLFLAFLGRGEFAVCHSRLWRFVSGPYSKIHDSSPLITWLKNSGSLSRRSRRSRHTSLRLAFCSVVRFFGTILAHTFLMSKSCVKIWWTINWFKFNLLLIILNINRWSDLTRDLTLGLLKWTCYIWTLVLWIGSVLHKPFVTFISHSSGFAKLYTKFYGTTLLNLLPVHFLNAPHKHNFTSDVSNNRIAAVASSNLYWVYGRG